MATERIEDKDLAQVTGGTFDHRPPENEERSPGMPNEFTTEAEQSGPTGVNPA